MSTLVIIESPGKRKKLEAILGGGYRVRASFGHVRDLPVKAIGVGEPDYRPEYVTEDDRAKATLKALREEVRGASRVLLATDPDREGEAIAWHLAEALRLRDFARVSYSEVTADAVTRAIAAPRAIDMKLVAAQEGRRVLDRLVGYLVSPALSQAGGERLSAGRVQSPALRLVVERDRAIAEFVSREHYSAQLDCGGWHADLVLPEGVTELQDRAHAEAASAVCSLRVTSCTDTTARRAPPPPFTTSTLQQAALTRLKLAPAVTMQLAQKLYEAGAITYMRSDSPNLSAEAYAKIVATGREVVSPQRMFKAKEGAQEGHEAIRPTDFTVTGVEGDAGALYALIFARALASQMPDARYAVRVAMLDGGAFAFEARGRTLVNAGWRALLTDDSEEEPEPDNAVPRLVSGDTVTAIGGAVIVKKTKAPARFTQGSLIAALESHGIGRPSTYAAILATLEKRGYVMVGKGASLTATEVGARLVDALRGRFAFVDLEYTRDMEAALDSVALGTVPYVRVVADAHEKLKRELAGLPAAAPPAGPPCPLCEGPTRKRSGSRGAFWSCCAYPECRGTVNIESATPATPTRSSDKPKRSSARGAGASKTRKSSSSASKPFSRRFP